MLLLPHAIFLFEVLGPDVFLMSDSEILSYAYLDNLGMGSEPKYELLFCFICTLKSVHGVRASKYWRWFDTDLNSPVLETKLYGVALSSCGPVTERLLQSVCSGFSPHCPEPQFLSPRLCSMSQGPGSPTSLLSFFVCCVRVCVCKGMCVNVCFLVVSTWGFPQVCSEASFVRVRWLWTGVASLGQNVSSAGIGWKLWARSTPEPTGGGWIIGRKVVFPILVLTYNVCSFVRIYLDIKDLFKVLPRRHHKKEYPPYLPCCGSGAASVSRWKEGIPVLLSFSGMLCSAGLPQHLSTLLMAPAWHWPLYHKVSS